MIVLIDGIKNGVNWKNFTFFIETPEAALDKISAYVLSGLNLHKVCLFDGGNFIELPVSVFDGQLFGPPIDYLQKQWESFLSDSSIQLK